MKTSTVRALCSVSLLACLVAFTGCRTHDDVSYRGITRNLTPELQGLRERPVDVDRHVQYTTNHNWRMFWDDLGRTFYTDHPSRLSPYPVFDASGNPR